MSLWTADAALGRGMGFNKTVVEIFFKNLKEIYERYKHRIKFITLTKQH